MAACLWCSSGFEPRVDGGKQQRFCRPRCRRAFDQATRRWARDALATGEIVVGAAGGAPATRALLRSRSQAQAMRIAWARPALTGEPLAGEPLAGEQP